MTESSAARSMETPKGLIKLRDGRLIPRRSGFLEPGEQPECPFHHRISAVTNLHEGALTVRCTHRFDQYASNSPHKVECGALLYVATGAMGRYWFDITTDEDSEIKRQGIKPTGVARFLGIHFPK